MLKKIRGIEREIANKEGELPAIYSKMEENYEKYEKGRMDMLQARKILRDLDPEGKPLMQEIDHLRAEHQALRKKILADLEPEGVALILPDPPRPTIVRAPGSVIGYGRRVEIDRSGEPLRGPNGRVLPTKAITDDEEE